MLSINLNRYCHARGSSILMTAYPPSLPGRAASPRKTKGHVAVAAIDFDNLTRWKYDVMLYCIL